MKLTFQRLACFVLFFGLLVISKLNAQTPLLAGWEKGDTLDYFITESELVESERISLETYTVRFYVKEHNPERSILEGHLYLPVPSNRGGHWKTFLQLLEKVPFTFYMQNGVSNTFQSPVQIETTMAALDQVMIDLVELENVQPIDYAEIAQWMNQLKPRNVLPPVLKGYFQPLNKVFDQFGHPPLPMGQIPFTDLIKDCQDSSIALKWLIDEKTHYASPDTLILTKKLLVDPNNDSAIYQTLANCEKLDGLEAIIQIDAYSNVQTEEWTILVNQGKIFSYKYDKVITMRFGELSTSRSKQTRIIQLK